MSRIKLKTKIALPQSVKEAQTAYKKAISGGTSADAAAVYAKEISKGTTPEDARLAARQAKRSLFRKAYIGQLDERYHSLKNDFKLHKAWGLLFTVIGVRIIPDYIKSRRNLRKNLDTIGFALSVEVARDPALRKAVSIVAKKYPYLSVNDKGEIFVSSYSGSIFNKDSVTGKLFDPSTLIPSKAEIRASKKAFGKRLDLGTILKMGSPRFESGKISSRMGRANLSPAKNITAAALGDNEIRVFSRGLVGGVLTSKEEVIKSENVKSKRIAASTVAGKKIIWLKMKAGKLVKLELDAKQAESVFKAFKLKK